MATIYKFEIVSHWINYHPKDMKKMIEKALYSCENEITVKNLEDKAKHKENESIKTIIRDWFWNRTGNELNEACLMELVDEINNTK